MRAVTRVACRHLRRQLPYSTAAKSASKPPAARQSAPPPPSKAYQAPSPEERIIRRPEQPEVTPTKKRSTLSRLWPFKPSPKAPITIHDPNPQRGAEAAQTVVKEGVLHPRYKAASRRIALMMATVPVVIVLSLELYNRRFNGKEQKQFPARKVPETTRE